MHGNNGSIDGDSAAAMRYTECRLSKVADLMLNDIKSETINFALNFDDSEKEPTILPAMIPNLLINGAMGIAAGYATNIPPFNPSEVFKAAIKIIDQPDIGLDEIKKIIPAPDFPTGGVIEGQEGIHEFFATGRGKFLISARITFDYDDKKVNKIIINEIPYETNKSQIIKQLSEILYDEKVSGLLEIRDESDKNGVCIVIEVKKDKNLDIIKSYLFKNTNLQVNYAANFVAIVDRKPMLLSLIDAINLYINHALDIQKKVAIFNLKKYEKRFEIVNGLMIAIKNIDKVITIIRNSESKESSKQNLINEFNFTDNQAEAIVNLRLYRLSKTNINDLLNESLELQKMIGELKLLISSEQLQKIALKQKIMSYI
ncbi:DNA topoisomerase IV subunit A, partial [bacterium]|nr:DNA topoisomerase IV subunit A [bacterium]